MLQNENQETNVQTEMKKSARGLASADRQTRERVAQLGGAAVSKNREHMSTIGKKGGEAVSRDRNHMSEIGRQGGKHSHINDQFKKNKEENM